MSFFVDRFNRRKSPIALAALGATLLDLCVFGVLYALLAQPLYYAVSLGSPTATNVAHTLIVAVIGTAVCCLLFLMKDKRVAPYSFLGLAITLCMFYAAVLLLDGDERSLMLYLVTIYGLAPVLVGNAVSWPIYLKMKRRNPALNHRKTISEELREAMEKEDAKRPSAPAPASEEKPEPKPSPVEEPVPADSADAMFGPDVSRNPSLSRSAQEEAMLLYEDWEDDEEARDD